MTDINNKQLPNLLFIGDVPVEETYHGSILLYRLFQDYPTNKLQIIEREPFFSQKHRRLPDVSYKDLETPLARPLNTYLYKAYKFLYGFLQSQEHRWIHRFTNIKLPVQAVISVHHGWGWITAYQYARKHRLPFFLICHDTQVTANLKLVRHFSVTAYQYATQRFCVSPEMLEEYRTRFDAEGVLLYPGRAKNPPCFDSPPERLSYPIKEPTLVFGGNLNQYYADLIKIIAEVLAEMNGRMILYGPHSKQSLTEIGLNLPNIELGGMVPSNQMVQQFREKGHCIYIPMSFEDSNKDNMQFSFPSKIVDSTIAGLPLFIHGPSYCSAIKWAKRHHGVGVNCESKDKQVIKQKLTELFSSSVNLLNAGKQSILIGKKLFDYNAIQKIFFNELKKAKSLR